MYQINTVSCPIIDNTNTIELTLHTSCYYVLNLLCITKRNKAALANIGNVCFSFCIRPHKQW